MKFTIRAGGRRRRPLARRSLTVVAAALALAGLAACSGTSSSGAGGPAGNGASGSSLTIADVAPFSGPDAALG
ncbi:MAG: hypothetical protein ACRDN0_36660, partial [Trebonia sp.]